MELLKIFPGCHYLYNEQISMLAGSPPEIVKVLLQKKLASPDILLLPDKPVNRGVSQTSIEFPLYHHLFFRHAGTSGPVPPLILIGSRRRVEAAERLIELTLFGVDEATMKKWGLPAAEAKQLYRECSWFHLKDQKGKRLKTRSLVTKYILEEEPVSLPFGEEELTVARIEPNVFSVTSGSDERVIDLNFDEEQSPPYPVQPDLVPASLVKFGVDVLGGSTGFSATQASSGLAMCYNGNYLLIDAIPYLNHHLRARGIARNQIQGLFLSHVHDDHCNIVSLMQYNRRVTILTTPLIFRMMLEKLSLVTDRSIDDLRGYFKFVPLEPGKETNYFGLKINPWWSIHSIPTIGAEFIASHAGKNYSVLFTGDTQSLDDIRKMHKQKVIGKTRFDHLEGIYKGEADMLLADGGEGMIHGDPSDALESPASRVVFMHLDELNEQFRAHFNVAQSGKRYPIVRGTTDYHFTRTIEFLLEYFPDMPSTWISNLLGDQELLQFNSGDIIIREGSRSQGSVYMILTGYAHVIQHSKTGRQVLAQMEAGELIGEMSVLNKTGTRNASVVAYSPVTVTEFSEKAFFDFLQHSELVESMKKLWEYRTHMQRFTDLAALPQRIVRRLAAMLSMVEITSAAQFEKLEAGSLIFPIDGSLTIQKNHHTVEIKPGKDLYLYRPDHRLRTMSKKKARILVLHEEDVLQLKHDIPVFRFFWEEQMHFDSLQE